MQVAMTVVLVLCVKQQMLTQWRDAGDAVGLLGQVTPGKQGTPWMATRLRRWLRSTGHVMHVPALPL